MTKSQMSEEFYVAFFLIVVISFIFLWRRSKSVSGGNSTTRPNNAFSEPRKLSISACHSIMRYGEQRFFRRLSEALPEYHIFPQVSFNVLITHAPHIYGTYINSVRQKFHHKFVDFVVCERATMKVFAVVEYDGSGHNNKNDAYRDEMLQSVGYRVERFSESDTLNSIQVRFGLNAPLAIDSPQIAKA
jgi:Protein of unknown function (DUF2726)